MKNVNKKTAFIILTLFAVFGFQSCSLWNKTPNLEVTVHLKRDNLDVSSVLVFNFKEPEYAEGSGAEVAEMFHLQLLRNRTFKVASLYSDSPWSRIAETEEKRLIQAIEEARSKQFDYILVGDLRHYYHGGLDRTRVHMKIRIIEVKTQTTIFLASNFLSHQGNDPTYPMQTKLSKISKPPVQVAERIVQQFIRHIGRDRRK